MLIFGGLTGNSHRMAKPMLILDQYFRLVEELFRPETYARLCDLAEVIGGKNQPMPLDEIDANLAQAQFLVAARPSLSTEQIAAAPGLRAIIEVSGAFNPGLDYDACFERGIEVLSSMPGFRFAVAEMAVGMMIAGARGLVVEHEENIGTVPVSRQPAVDRVLVTLCGFFVVCFWFHREVRYGKDLLLIQCHTQHPRKPRESTNAISKG